MSGPAGASRSPVPWWVIAGGLLIALLHGVVSLSQTAPGPISIDECTHLFSLRGAALTGSPQVVNGYDQCPSPELEVRTAPLPSGHTSSHVHAHGAHLVAQYPSLPDFLAAPLYPTLGYGALFLVNAVAFLVVLLLIYATASVLFSSAAISAVATLIFAGCTFAWQYSQAAWPHMQCLMWTCAALYFGTRAVLINRSQHASAATRLAATAGLCAGVAVNVRTDAILYLVALGFVLLLLGLERRRLCVAYGLGSLPGLVAASVFNSWKFGTPNPLSYGYESTAVGQVQKLGLLGVLALGAAFALTHPKIRARLKAQSRLRWIAIGSLVLLAALLIPSTRAVLNGIAQLVVDLRLRPERTEPALTRTASGALVYMGALKKSLLQSCPYLTLASLSVWTLWRSPEGKVKLGLISIVPLVYLAFFGTRGWHGGLSLNLRYFLPVLPGASLLVAISVVQLWHWSQGVSTLLRAACWLFAALLPVLIFEWRLDQAVTSPTSLEWLVLDAPLFIALAVLLTALTAAMKRTAGFACLASVATACGLGWATMTALRHDYSRTHQQRELNAAVSAELRNVIPDDAVVFISGYEKFAGLLDRSHVVLARPSNDGAASSGSLAHCFLQAGRPVYLAGSSKDWNDFRRVPGMIGISAEEIRSPAGLAVQRLFLAP